MVKSSARIEGFVDLPGDKSVSHRALILNSVAKGTARISGLSTGADVQATIRCLRSLGVDITDSRDPSESIVHGVNWDFKESPIILDSGNSGTTMRLLSGVLATQPFLSIITGDESLRTRPMGRVIQPLLDMGASVMGRCNNTMAPIAIRGGSLNSIDCELAVPSAQVKSSIILAALRSTGDTVIHQPSASRDHTERLIRVMGAAVEADGLALKISPGPLNAVDVNVPGDISAAAFWLVAAACHPNASLRLHSVGVNPGRVGILDVLRQMGADVTLENNRLEGGEPVADLCVKSSRLAAVEIGGDEIPKLLDEIPIIAVAACFATGTTIIRNAKELRYKESDRINTTVSQLARLGASIEERPDGMVIHGNNKLEGTSVESYGDHRLAMALAVAGLLSSGETVVKGAESVMISYPRFWDHLDELTNS